MLKMGLLEGFSNTLIWLIGLLGHLFQIQNETRCPFIYQQQTNWGHCQEEKYHFLCQKKKLRMMVKRETIKTQALNFAFSKAEAVVNTTASKVKALEIHNMENNDESKFLASYSRKMSFSKKKTNFRRGHHFPCRVFKRKIR